jgi:predicted alpha/beta hydrolase family esterase
MNVLILHGLNGSDFPHWQAHLAGELIEEDHVVLFPELENKETPKLQQWLDELHEIILDFSPDVVVCHSLATILWFHYLARHSDVTQLKKLLLVAPPSLTTSLQDASDFFPVLLPRLINSSKESLLVLSTNDPYLPLDEAKKLEETIDIPVYWVENAGHINTSAGFGEWEFAKKWILQ